MNVAGAQVASYPDQPEYEAKATVNIMILTAFEWTLRATMSALECCFSTKVKSVYVYLMSMVVGCLQIGQQPLEKRQDKIIITAYKVAGLKHKYLLE